MKFKISVCVVGALCVCASHAVERTWNGADGANWTDESVWTTNGVATTAPENTDTVTINNGTTVNLTGAALSDTNRFAMVQLNGNSRGALVVGPSAYLPTAGLEVSRSGTGPTTPGTIIVDGGYVNANATQYIGTDSTNNPGRLEVINGGNYTNASYFRVYGGSVLVSNATFTSLNTSYLHGSSLTSTFEIVDSAVNLAAFAIGRDVQNGSGKACRNVLRVRSGSLNMSGTLEVGWGGLSSAVITGVVEQTGGTVTIGGSGTLSIPVFSYATGIYELSGGVLTLQSGSEALRLGGRDKPTPGFFIMSDGVFTNKGTTSVGGSQISTGVYGRFVQSGGHSVFEKTLYVGNNANATGEVSLAGGTLKIGSSSYLYVGNASNAVGRMTVSGGVLDGTGRTMSIGSAAFGNGTFVQTGGVITNGAVNVGSTSFGNGTLVLSNGTFYMSGTLTVGQTNAVGSVEVDGGTLTMTGSTLLGNQYEGSGSLVMSGGAITNNGVSLASVLGSAGALTVNGGEIYSTGEFYLGHGSIGKGGVATFAMTGGKITTPYRFIVGSYGSATATVSGGEIEALRNPATGGTDQCFEVGRDSGSFGQLVMTGGALKGTNELVIARDSGSTGRVCVAGGDLYFNSIRRGSGLCTFNLAGGTLHPYNRNPAFAFTATLTNDIGYGETGTRFGLSSIDKDGVARVMHATCTFTGNGGLAKRDEGTVTLGGTLAYTGDTVVEAGTLALSNAVASLASGTIEVASGATLDVSLGRAAAFPITSGQALRGAGAVKGPVRLATGASLSGGSAVDPEVLTIDGDLTLEAGSTLLFNMLSGTYSRVHVTGDLNLSATANLTVNGAATTDAQGRPLLSWDGNLNMPTATRWTVAGEKDPFVVINHTAKALTLSYIKGTVILVK